MKSHGISHWPAELRKQHRRIITNWNRREPCSLSGTRQAEAYYRWRLEQGLTGPVAVVPASKAGRSARDEVRKFFPPQQQLEVSLEDYT